jgi:Ca2+-binding RTX toxin-like protein
MASNPGSLAVTPSTDTLKLHLSEDAFQGDAQFTLTLDGVQPPHFGPQRVTASHAAGQVNEFAVSGAFGPGPHTVAINFINDAWGGTPATDRNLYVHDIVFDDQRYPGTAAQDNANLGITDPNAAPMFVNGTVTFTNVTGPAPAGRTIVGTAGPDTLTGTAGDDTIIALGGNDTLIGNGGNDTLLGGPDDDYLVAGQGSFGNPFTTNANGKIVLDGGPGNDTLLGGPNTTYIIHAGNGSDTILNHQGGTVDIDGYAIGDRATLLSHVTFGPDIARIDLGNGETLTFAEGPPIVPGNPGFFSDVNFVFTDVQTTPGTPPGPTPTPDEPRGYIAPDATGTARGTPGADAIFSTANNQTLIGNGGDDVFHIGTNTGVVIAEHKPGVSEVATYLTQYTLPDGVDNLTAQGNYAHRLTGNGSNNVIAGAAGDDTINGAGGTDLFIGGGGHDTFVVDATRRHEILNALQPHVADFSPQNDIVDLRGYVAAAELGSDPFASGKLALHANAQGGTDLVDNTQNISAGGAPIPEPVITLDHLAPSSLHPGDFLLV